ncbi:MAG: OB-fold domain-containing protein [Dehalococcoidia bacterium]|nr:OB-fold domain-containing protein [Dehalococcoidia bacterium]
MAGITSYGAYVPLWRLSREAIMKGLRGEKAIRNFDEDSTTMGVAAAIDCLKGQDREAVEGLFFASTTSPYREKQISATIAAAADLRQDIVTADFGNSMRAGTAALRAALDAVRAGSAKKVLVVASDCRMGAPGTDFEQYLGDGAAALLVGESGVVASVDGWYSISNELNDIWRRDDDAYVRAWEDRFVNSVGYLDTVGKAVAGLLEKSGLKQADFAKAVIAAPSPRIHGEAVRKLGFDPKAQGQEHFIDVMGNTGTAYPLMLLVAAMETAKPGDRLLLSCYGNGSDAIALRAGPVSNGVEGRRGIAKHLSTKRIVDDYRVYLQWRELLTFESAPTPPGGHISSSAQWRDRSQIFPLHGLKCLGCGGIHFPPQRVCPKCRARDRFEEVRLSDKKGTIYTFSADNLCSRREAPRVTAIIDFDGGGRMATLMTDRVLEEIQVGMPVEMSFRRIASQDGVHNYFWKSIPVRK